MASDIIYWLVKKLKKLKEAVLFLAGIGVVVLFMNISGIGCPIKWMTGVSCAGCGMTRALFYAAQLRFDKAFYYHPLFWMVPFCILFFLFREKLSKKIQNGIAWTVLACFAAVYVIRIFYSDNGIVSADLEAGAIVRLWRYFT